MIFQHTFTKEGGKEKKRETKLRRTTQVQTGHKRKETKFKRIAKKVIISPKVCIKKKQTNKQREQI